MLKRLRPGWDIQSDAPINTPQMTSLLKQPKTRNTGPPAGLELRRADLAVLLLLAGFLMLGLWRLQEVPTNVTGDEVTFLNDILHITYAPDKVSLLSLMGDGSKAAIDMYYLALVAKAFAEEQAVVAMRVASVILGMATLGAFYLYLRSKVRLGPALCAVLLLGTNYVYLNLSRSVWMADGKGLGLICGLLSFWLVERATSRGKLWLSALGGAAGGLALYSYSGTIFLPVASILFFVYLALRRRISPRAMLVQGAVFGGVAIAVFLPNLWTIWQNYDTYTMRSRSVYVAIAEDEPYRAMDAGTMAWHQISYTVKGFLLLDPAITGDGPENGRYGPTGEAPVDALTRGAFLLAVPAAIFLRRRGFFQPVVAFILMLVITQMLTVYPPNYSRGIFALPFIYLLIAMLLDTAWSSGTPRRYVQAGLMATVVAVSAWNAQHYFEWGTSPELAEARQPAIEYSQIPLWIDAEKQLIAAGEVDLAITDDNWQQLLRTVGLDQL